MEDTTPELNLDDNEDEMRLAAYHEAGHFVAAVIVGNWPDSVTITLPGAGSVNGITSGTTAATIMWEAISIFAGGVATEYISDYDWLGATEDNANISMILALAFEQPERAYEVVERLTYHLFSFRRVERAVHEVAEWLMRNHAPDEDEVERVVSTLYGRFAATRRKVWRWIDEALRDQQLGARATVDILAAKYGVVSEQQTETEEAEDGNTAHS